MGCLMTTHLLNDPRRHMPLKGRRTPRQHRLVNLMTMKRLCLACVKRLCH